MTRCCPRRARTTRPRLTSGAGSGSSTRSTAPASSPSRRATTGPCTSRSGRPVTWWPAPWPSPRSGRRSTPAAAPVVPPTHRRAVPGSRSPAAARRSSCTALAAELDADLVPMGSAGVKVISVVRDITDAYVHAGGQYEWDSAAPVAVARAAGPVHLPDRRLAAGVQPGRRLPARPDRVPSRAVRADPRLRPAARDRLTTLRVERPRTGPSSRGPRGRACGSAP